MATEKPTSTTHVVNFITGNKNKLSEVKAILEPTIEVRSQALDLIEVQGTLDEVTIAKCKSAAEQVRPLICEKKNPHVSRLCQRRSLTQITTSRSEAPCWWRTPAFASTRSRACQDRTCELPHELHEPCVPPPPPRLLEDTDIMVNRVS